MVFEISSGKEFKAVVDRVMAVVPKYPSLEVLSCVKITAGDNCIRISGTDYDQFVTISMPAIIIEPGEVFIHMDDIIKVYNLDGWIKVEAKDGSYIARNEKKCCKVFTKSYGNNDVVCCTGNVPTLYEVTEAEMVQSLVALDKMRSMEQSRPIMTGFNVRGDLHRMATCDGHRLGIKVINGTFHNENFNVTLPGYVCSSMKKIAHAKSDNTIIVGYGTPNNSKNKMVKITGSDFDYWCTPLYGEFLNVESIIQDIRTEYSFDVNASELNAISKEYNKVLKKSKLQNGIPMFFCGTGDSVYTAAITRDYGTTDCISENCRDIPEFVYACDASYINDAVNLFDDDIHIAIENKNSNGYCIGFMKFTDEKAEYKAYVLPVRVRGETETYIRTAKELIAKV